MISRLVGSVARKVRAKRFCPINPGCRRYVHDVARMLALEKPCFMMLDNQGED